MVSAGRRNGPVARYIKKFYGGRPRLVHMMDPECGYGDFSLIVMPLHDRFARKGRNVMRVVGAPHRVRAGKLAEEADAWQPKFAGFPKPWVALIVGGSVRGKAPLVGMAKDMVERTVALTGGTGTVFFTTSPNTEKDFERELLKHLPPNSYKYLWKQTDDPNPYIGFMALADKIVVTGDSMSMCSEAAGSNAREVYIFAPEETMTPKYLRLHDSLYEAGCAKPLGSPYASGEPRHRLNVADDVAVAVHHLMA